MTGVIFIRDVFYNSEIIAGNVFLNIYPAGSYIDQLNEQGRVERGGDVYRANCDSIFSVASA